MHIRREREMVLAEKNDIMSWICSFWVCMCHLVAAAKG